MGDSTALLRAEVQLLLRRFGLLRDTETPCGKPLQLSHAHALMVLLERERAFEGTRHKDLVDALGLDKSSIVRLCRRMEAEGHVTQSRAQDDGRARDVALTTKGTNLARELETSSRARFERVVEALPRGHRRRVVEALEILNAAVATLDSGEKTK